MNFGSATALVAGCGALAALGVVLIVHGTLRTQPRLGDVLARLDGGGGGVRGEGPAVDAHTASERAGVWLFRRGWVPITDAQRRLLELRGKSIAEFCADKAIMAALGIVTPAVVCGLLAWVSSWPVTAPVVAALIGGIVGWFAPDLMLKRGAESARSGAGEALFSYFDLVVLERMANLSATQSLTSAAELSDAPMFVQIRAALARARLQQQPPGDELHRLADRLRVPELGDIADVMRLDESGAALTETLRARVRELRDAHLTAMRIAAHEVSERMTVYMVMPAMIFGLIFLTPPLLRLVGLA